MFFVYHWTISYNDRCRYTEIKACDLREYRLVSVIDVTQDTPHTDHFNPIIHQQTIPNRLFMTLTHPLLTLSSSRAARTNRCYRPHTSTLCSTKSVFHILPTLQTQPHPSAIPNTTQIMFTQARCTKTSSQIGRTRYILHQTSNNTNHATSTRTHQSVQKIPNPTTDRESTQISYPETNDRTRYSRNLESTP